MSQFVADCPRCGVKEIAFNVWASVVVGVRHDWMYTWEVFCECGRCHRTTVFIVELTEYILHELGQKKNGLVGRDGTINRIVRNLGYVSAKDKAAITPPEHLPPKILDAFNEGAKCMAVDCFNAAGTMFRLCVDMTTKDKLPDGDAAGLNYKTRRDLGLRLPWLFDNRYLPEDLRDLSHCIKEDGNDGAHQGTLSEADALDLLDFTEALLKRVYTEPERLRLAKERRDQRRAS